MHYYERKPEKFHAAQYNGEVTPEIEQIIGRDNWWIGEDQDGKPELVIDYHYVGKGDWVTRTIGGELRIVRDSELKEHYNRVEYHFVKAE